MNVDAIIDFISSARKEQGALKICYNHKGMTVVYHTEDCPYCNGRR